MKDENNGAIMIEFSLEWKTPYTSMVKKDTKKAKGIKSNVIAYIIEIHNVQWLYAVSQ